MNIGASPFDTWQKRPSESPTFTFSSNENGVIKGATEENKINISNMLTAMNWILYMDCIVILRRTSFAK